MSIIVAVAGIIAILTGIAAMLRVLISISMKLGGLLERLTEHIRLSVQIHSDQEARLRNLENRELERVWRRDRR